MKKFGPEDCLRDAGEYLTQRTRSKIGERYNPRHEQLLVLLKAGRCRLAGTVERDGQIWQRYVPTGRF